MSTPERAVVLRRRRVAALWVALGCAVVEAGLCLATSRGTSPFGVGAVLLGVAVGLPVALGTGLVVERSARALRR